MFAQQTIPTETALTSAPIALTMDGTLPEPEWSQDQHGAELTGAVPVRVRDIGEVTYELVSVAPVEGRLKMDLGWLQDFYRCYFGTSSVEYEWDDTNWRPRRRMPTGPLTLTLTKLGVPDIVTWSAWMVLSRHVQEGHPLAFDEPHRVSVN